MKNKKKEKLELRRITSSGLGVFLTMLCLVFFQATVFGQTRTITGKVTDETGEGLPGVTIVINGTTQGTVSNIDGDIH